MQGLHLFPTVWPEYVKLRVDVYNVPTPLSSNLVLQTKKRREPTEQEVRKEVRREVLETEKKQWWQDVKDGIGEEPCIHPNDGSDDPHPPNSGKGDPDSPKSDPHSPLSRFKGISSNIVIAVHCVIWLLISRVSRMRKLKKWYPQVIQLRDLLIQDDDDGDQAKGWWGAVTLRSSDIILQYDYLFIIILCMSVSQH